ncbi:MAG: hypothetical protein ACOY94_18695 [Bacillota bacterium]
MKRTWFVPIVVVGVMVLGFFLRDNFGVNLRSPWLLVLGGGGLVVCFLLDFLTRPRSQ